MNANISNYERKHDVNHQYTICEVCGDDIAKARDDTAQSNRVYAGRELISGNERVFCPVCNSTKVEVIERVDNKSILPKHAALICLSCGDRSESFDPRHPYVSWKGNVYSVWSKGLEDIL